MRRFPSRAFPARYQIQIPNSSTKQSPKEKPSPLSFLIRGRNMCHAMTNSCPHVRAGHSNCSAQQKAEIPIQSLESSGVSGAHSANGPGPPPEIGPPRESQRTLAGCNDEPTIRSTTRLQFFTLRRPLFPSSPLKTNNERDQSLTEAAARRDLGRRMGGRTRATRKMFECTLLFVQLLPFGRSPSNLFRPPQYFF